ncbi:MAG: hypothetical protein CMM94_05415 [Rickettsiales bacterium]|nr:hypothetical protein [Rickettsiales bacterium]
MNLDIFLNAVLGYAVIISPLGTALLFNALTDGADKTMRRQMAVRGTIIGIVLVILFGFFGLDLMNGLGIQIESFRVAGGLLLFYTAFSMITTPEKRRVNSDAEEIDDVSVYPLAIPLLSGPGTLTLTILLFSDASGEPGGLFSLLAAIVLVFIVTFVALLFSTPLEKLLGKTINNIFKRLFGVLLAALAIQFIVDGVRGIVEAT